MQYKGNHVLADFKGFYGNEIELGEYVYELMIEAIINRTDMKIMHKHLEILNKGTPPGFSAFLSLDSSHISAHSYTNIGLLAMDIFTCGTTDTLDVMNYIKDKLSSKFPSIECTYIQNHNRFHY